VTCSSRRKTKFHLTQVNKTGVSGRTLGQKEGKLRKTLVVYGVLAFCTVAANASIIYGTSFENPAFTLGSLSGQNGWATFGNANVVVQNAIVKSGLQAVEIDARTTQSGALHFDSPGTGVVVSIQADIYLTSSSNETAWQFGVYNGFGGINILPGGSLQILTPGFPVTGPLVNRDVWNNFQIDYNEVAGQFNVFLNGTPVATNEAMFSGFGYSFATLNSFGYTGANDVAFLDNFSVSAVPEPSSLLLLGSGILGLGGLVRRKLTL